MSRMGDFYIPKNKIQKITAQILYYKYIVYTFRFAYAVNKSEIHITTADKDMMHQNCL